MKKVLPDIKYRGVSCRRWFEKRFKKKPESDALYYMEWVSRFRKGPFPHMDSKSKATFRKMVKKGR